MSDPLIDPADLGLVLNDDSINVDRAQHIIDRAQTLCETVVKPLPAGAEVVVERVAARGYVTITSARQMQLDMADAAYGTQAGPVGAVYLDRYDRDDLLAMAAAAGGKRGGAFSINMIPAGYSPVLPPWDVNNTSGIQIETS